jgi:branched-chain amino acid transport system substrate-binding protein
VDPQKRPHATTNKRKRLTVKRVLPALVLGSLLAASCGDDDESSNTTIVEASATTTGGTSAGADTAAGDTTAAGTTGTQDSGSPAGSTASPASGEPIVIGFAASLTGPQSTFDLPIRQGIELAIDDINAAGGVGGRPLELSVVDSQSDIAASSSAALELIEQGVDVLVPPADFNLAQPAAIVATEAGVLSLSGIGDPSFGYETLGELVFNLYQGTPTEGAVAAEWVKQLGAENPFLLENVSLDYTKSLCSSFEDSWTATGEIAGSDTFQITDESFQAQVTQVLESDADVVMLCGIPVEGPAVIRQLRAAGVDVPIVTGAAFEGSYWFEGAGEVNDVHVVASRALPEAETNVALAGVLERFEAKFGAPPATATFVAFGYSIVEAVARAVDEAGGATEGAELAAVMNTWTDVEFLTGPTTYTATCHVPVGRPMVIVSINANVETVAQVLDPAEVPDKRC